MAEDIRWKQRLNNWNRALAQFTGFMQRDALNELEEQGLIQSFEYNHELAWKTQQNFLKDQGFSDLLGSKDVARKAFEIGLVEEGEVWLDMIVSRNLTFHTYNEAVTRRIVDAIVDHYFDALCKLNSKLNQLAQDD